MSDKYLHLDTEFVKAEIAKLIAAYPELADDETLRSDSIEAQTNALRIIERALAERQDADALAGSIRTMEADLSARRSRFERKAEAMKRLIMSVMKAARLQKLTLPAASLSITPPRTSVGIENLDDLPQGFFKKQADKAAIKSALEQGEQIPGAFLVTGDEGLLIRTK